MGHSLWEDPGLKNAWLIIARLVEVRRGRARGQIAHELKLLLLLLLLLFHQHLHHLLQLNQRVIDRQRHDVAYVLARTVLANN